MTDTEDTEDIEDTEDTEDTGDTELTEGTETAWPEGLPAKTAPSAFGAETGGARSPRWQNASAASSELCDLCASSPRPRPFSVTSVSLCAKGMPWR